MARGTTSARFLVEVDGIPAIVAMEATPPALKHTPVKYQPGNQPMPTHLRGNSEVEEFSMKHARAIGEQGKQLATWLRDYIGGRSLVQKNVRFITMSEDGRTPLETWECLDCTPTMYKPESASGTGTDAASFSFSVQPDNARLI